MIAVTAALLVLGATAVLIPADVWSQGIDVRVNNVAEDLLTTGVTQSETSLAMRVNPAAICIGFRDFGHQPRRNAFAVSSNDGTSFDDDGCVPVSPGDPFADPSLVLTSAGEFLYASVRGGFAGLDLHRSRGRDRLSVGKACTVASALGFGRRIRGLPE